MKVSELANDYWQEQLDNPLFQEVLATLIAEVDERDSFLSKDLSSEEQIAALRKTQAELNGMLRAHEILTKEITSEDY